MNHEQQLQLQAYLDGELTEGEARKVADLLSSSEEARKLFSELQFTKTAIVDNEPEYKLPETREFFWSRIEREIRNSEPVRAQSAEPISVFGWLQRILVPVASVALIAFLAVFAFNRADQLSSPLAQSFSEIQAASEEMGTITFRSEAERMTVVWVYDRADLAGGASTINSYE